jgi:bla regulator protein BlaR1
MLYSIVYNHVLIPSLISIAVVIFILLIKSILKKRLSAEWHYYIWFLLLIRLLLPYNIQTNFSIYNYIKMPTENIINQIPTSPNVETTKTVSSSSVSKVQSNMIIKKNEESNNKLQNDIVSESINIISIIWLAGVTLILTYVFVVNIKSYSLLRKNPLYKNKKLNELLKECKYEMKIKAEISIVAANKIVNVPSLWGILKAQIVIPLALVDKLTDQELKYIIFHELSHFKRKDNIINLFLTAIKIVNWFNPFIWYAFYIMNEDSEIACDAIVLRHIQKEETLKYGNTLIALYQLTSIPKELVGITTLFKNKSQLKRRINMITKFKKKSITWSIVVIVFVVFIGVFTLTNGKKPSEHKKNSAIATTKKEVATTKKEVATTSVQKSDKPTNNTIANTTSNSNATVSNSNANTNTTAVKPSSNTTKTSSTNQVQQPQPQAQQQPQTQPQQPKAPQQPAVNNQNQQSNNTNPPASPQQYVSTNLGFSITFPASWQGKYTVQEDGNGIKVCFKPKQQQQILQDSDFGLLFKIVKRGPGVDEGVIDGIPGAERYFTAKGISYVIGSDTDISFPDDSPEFNNYLQLSKDSPTVINTLKSINF